MSRCVAVIVNGELEVHLPGAASDYITLCGLDGNDRGQKTVAVPRGAKVDCFQCRRIWDEARKFNLRDFKS